jgi:hypothetical protein
MLPFSSSAARIAYLHGMPNPAATVSADHQSLRRDNDKCLVARAEQEKASWASISKVTSPLANAPFTHLEYSLSRPPTALCTQSAYVKATARCAPHSDDTSKAVRVSCVHDLPSRRPRTPSETPSYRYVRFDVTHLGCFVSFVWNPHAHDTCIQSPPFSLFSVIRWARGRRSTRLPRDAQPVSTARIEHRY